MLTLRKYQSKDAESIVGWFKDELSFRKWAADRFTSFPLTPLELNHKYLVLNGDCEKDCFFPFVFEENGNIVGSMIMRFPDEDKHVIRFGFVVIDDSLRGKGYGKKMLEAGIKYAYDVLNVDKITIGVFENNFSAYACYKKLGFQEVATSYFKIENEDWKCIELELTK